jgi:hypothetical protein
MDGYVACIGKVRNAYKILVGKSEGMTETPWDI